MDPTFIDDRAERLLRLAYARLKVWLGLEWSEASTDLVVTVNDEDDLLDNNLDDEPQEGEGAS
jgi:hypothetical protein